MKPRIFAYSAIFFLALGLLFGCANRGSGPQGGPRDEQPPKVMKQNPKQGSTNFGKKTIVVEFDENITVDNIAENLVISPPQQHQPNVQAINKKLTIQFEDTLESNTTYSLDFGNAIVDNNEKNVLENFVISFSTGDEIDTLGVSGIILDAENLNPLSGITAGIHPAASFSDTTLQTTVFRRIGRTDKDGNFTIQNVRPGTYRLFGLGDNSRDNIYQQGEGIAICDSLITPVIEFRMQSDTVWKDSLTIDTVKWREIVERKPDSIVLLYFKEEYTRHYLQKLERPKDNRFTLLMGAPPVELPSVRLIPDTMHPEINVDSARLFVQLNAARDTINCWLTDSTLILTDTLYAEVTYLKSDSLFRLQTQVDTLRALFRRPKETKAQKKKREQEQAQAKVKYANITASLPSALDITSAMRIKSETPLAVVDTQRIHVFQVIDTVRTPVQCELQADTVGIGILLRHAWSPDTHYELLTDSAAFIDIYNQPSKQIKAQTKTKSLEEYATIVVEIKPYMPNVILQFLNGKDQPVREMPASPDGAKFEHMAPGDYYLRMIVDANGDGKWTTGELKSGRQPEQVFYFPGKLSMRANWDFHEIWDYTSVPLTRQKPKAIKGVAKKDEKN